jgi:NNP family nitrate/nitrite transporter-like MFS transporter
MNDLQKANIVLAANTIAFAICFACWMMNAVLVTFLNSNGIFDWSPGQVGMLMATPVLTGSLLRLPMGALADRFGGRIVNTLLMLAAAAALFLNGYANTYFQFLIAALGFGIAGSSFAVGVAYTSAWFPKERQGTALGIFGMGNAGTALTLMLAPALLRVLTAGGTNLAGWRNLPRVYAAILAATAIVYYLSTFSRKPPASGRPLRQRLAPLGEVRVWRFGLYYALLFGGFVALSNWLVPYYVKAYGLALGVAGFYATIFSLPSGLFRAVGGWLSDRLGARAVMRAVLTLCMLLTLGLFFPQMDIITPGEGILARFGGTVVSKTATELVVARDKTGKPDIYQLKGKAPVFFKKGAGQDRDSKFTLIPKTETWQEWAAAPQGPEKTKQGLEPGDHIDSRQLLARGFTHIYFQANVYVFTFLVLLLGMAMGIGMAAVFKHIPTYFPNDVGIVGGLVGVIGGLGGFVFPIVFGWLLSITGIWTTCWVFLFVLSVICLVWMRSVLMRALKQSAPQLLSVIDSQAHRDGASQALGSSSDADSAQPVTTGKGLSH